MATNAVQPGQLCDWCWDDSQTEVPAVTMVAGVPLCLNCARGNKKPRSERAPVQVDTKPKRYSDASKLKPMPQQPTHIPAAAVLDPQILTRDFYVQRFGLPGKKRLLERNLQMWEKVKALPMGSIMILPMKSDESGNHARSRYSNQIQRFVKMYKPTFRVRLASNTAHHHVALWKESIPVS